MPTPPNGRRVSGERRAAAGCERTRAPARARVRCTRMLGGVTKTSSRGALACGRHDPIHAEIHDELTVVIRGMPDGGRREP
jgi:hypothetical protein